jgi:hypothetical protein
MSGATRMVRESVDTSGKVMMVVMVHTTTAWLDRAAMIFTASLFSIFVSLKYVLEGAVCFLPGA